MATQPNVAEQRDPDRLSLRRTMESIINTVIGFLCVTLLGGVFYIVSDYSSVKGKLTTIQNTTTPALQNQIDVLRTALEAQKAALEIQRLALFPMTEMGQHLDRLDREVRENWTNINNIGGQVNDVRTETKVLKSRLDNMDFFKGKSPQ